MTVEPLPDHEAVVRDAQGGDRLALERLLRHHQPDIYAICRRMAGNDPDALDATQEALIAVVRGLPRFDGRSRFSTWVYRVATNACLDELRRRKRRPLALVDDETTLQPDPATTDDRIDGTADRLEIDEALGLLSHDFRVAVVLRDLCQLDYQEISEVLDVPVGTVRSRIARGRAQLAETLSGNQSTPSDRLNQKP